MSVFKVALLCLVLSGCATTPPPYVPPAYVLTYADKNLVRSIQEDRWTQSIEITEDQIILEMPYNNYGYFLSNITHPEEMTAIYVCQIAQIQNVFKSVKIFMTHQTKGPKVVDASSCDFDEIY